MFVHVKYGTLKGLFPHSCFNHPACSSVEARTNVDGCIRAESAEQTFVCGVELVPYSISGIQSPCHPNRLTYTTPHIHMHRYVTDSKKSILYCKPAWSRIYLLFNIGHCGCDNTNRQSRILVPALI